MKEYPYQMELRVYNQELLIEMRRAQTQWGPEFDKLNTQNDWIAFIVSNVGAAVVTRGDGSFRQKLLKAAGLCMSAVLWWDATNGNMPRRHYD